ncbi:BTB/POZ protein [Gigaspora margarita]|uniref:BTB/POZ protein n=1 Tax=Gigaspora margarita TaxID=4874 RepID=A0A8H4AG41_GIGMA|nr:BTB/POZ protein [Gigaspora margarita]
MDELLEHVKNTVIKNEMDDEIIILNVGGVKFETTRKTLIANPETTLGKLFDSQNSEALKPIHPNAINRFVTKVNVTYRSYGSIPGVSPFDNYENGKWFVEFEKQGHGLLNNEKIVSAIEKRLKNHFPSIKVTTERGIDYITLIMEDYLDMDSLADNL